MEISRENLFDMLGNDSRKYHSCILTTFSFDFSFFELHAMRRLKNAGVRNILVLVDEGILNELNENPSGFEFRQNATYGIYPMSAQGVFHSKLIFCAGRSEGFLAIGSGNLTAAGHGSNDEIWSAFHYKGEDSPNAGIYSQTWDYIQSLKKEIRGNSLDKIIRLQEHAKWIDNLPVSKPGLQIKLKDETISVHPANGSNSLLREAIKTINGKTVSSITLISPFYDIGGRLIEDMRTNWAEAEINVVIDCNFGTAPGNCDAANINYFDWHKVFQNNENDISRLHGKLIVFKLEVGVEFVITGSSNATDAGFGLLNHQATNQELNLFISRKNASTIESLGIQLSDFAKISKPELSKASKHDVFAQSKKHKKTLKIQFAELEGSNLMIGTSGPIESKLQLKFFNRENRMMHALDVTEPKERMAIKLNEKNKGAFLTAWYDLNDDQISGKAIIQDTNLHHLTNPDQKSEKLQHIFLEIENGNYDVVSELFQYVNFDIDKTENNSRQSHSGMMKREDDEEESKYFRAENYDEFTKVSEEKILKQKHLLSSTSLQIAEFLQYIQKTQMSSENKELSEEAKLTDIDNDDGIDDQNNQKERKTTTTRSEFTRTSSALQNFLRQLTNHIKIRKVAIIDAVIRQDVPEIRMSINDYSNINIAMHLLYRFTNKHADIFEEEQRSQEVYLKVIGQHPWENLKSFIIETLPGFILLAQQGDVDLEEDTIRVKLINQKREALYNIIFLTCNAPFKQNEKTLIRIIQANVILLLLCQSEKSDDIKDDLDKWIWEKYADIVKKNPPDDQEKQTKKTEDHYQYLNHQFKTNYEQFSDNLFAKVAAFSKNRIEKRLTPTDVHDLNGNESIFVSKYGICKIDKILPRKVDGRNQKRLVLMNPGFNNGKRECTKIEPFTKVIKTGIKL